MKKEFHLYSKDVDGNEYPAIFHIWDRDKFSCHFDDAADVFYSLEELTAFFKAVKGFNFETDQSRKAENLLCLENLFIKEFIFDDDEKIAEENFYEFCEFAPEFDELRDEFLNK